MHAPKLSVYEIDFQQGNAILSRVSRNVFGRHHGHAEPDTVSSLERDRPCIPKAKIDLFDNEERTRERDDSR